jgi:hypothetical protein
MMALVLGMTLFSLRRPIVKAGPRVVAEQTGEFLRRARNRAQTENTPVAVVFPRAGGGSPTCQSVAERSGETHPQIRRIKDFSEENPDTVLFVGMYGASGTWSIAPLSAAGSDSFTQDVSGYPGSARIIEWVGAATAEPMVIFLPDGSAVANDLPHLDGAYRIVVSQGVVSAGESAPDTGIMPAAPAFHRLSEVSNPYTIAVDASGAVRVSPGLMDGDGSTAVSEIALPLGSPAPRMAIASQTSLSPEITKLTAEPIAGYLQGAFGIEQMIKPGRQLTFRVVAKQNNDEELFCEFEEATGQGQFSSPGPKKMRYQPAAPPFFEASWWGSWQWAPPPSAAEGDLFTVNATVTASGGGSDTTAGDATFSTDIYMMNLGRIFFGAHNSLTNRSEIYCVSADGTDLHRVTTQEALETAQMSPAGTRDGNKLLYQSVDNLTLKSSIYGQSRKGGVATLITDEGVHPSLSDDGTVTVFQQYLGFLTTPTLYTVNPDQPFWPPILGPVFNPDPGLAINNSPAGLRAPSVSNPMPFSGRPAPPPPDFVADPKNRRVKMPRRIAFESNLGLSDPSHVAIYTADFHDPAKPIEPHNVIRQTQGGFGGDLVTPGGDLQPVWHPDGTKIAFWSRRGGLWRAYAIPFNDGAAPEVPESGDGAVCLTPGFNNARYCCYSPDGTRLVFASDDHDPGNEWDLYIVMLNPATNFLTPQGTPNRVHLGEYAIFSKLFERIDRPVWTL